MSQSENHDVQIYATSITFMLLSVIAVVLRLASSRMRQNKLLIDDYLVIVALLLAIAACIQVCISKLLDTIDIRSKPAPGVTQYGIGRHLDTLSPDMITNYLKMIYILGAIQPCILLLTKISILILYRRIFITPKFRLITHITMGIVVLWWICTFWPDLLICLPPEQEWDPSVQGYCGNFHLLTVLSPIPWMATDLSILVMPIPMVAKLQMPLSQRIALSAVFLLGGFALVSTIIRYTTTFYSSEDPTYSETGIVIWTVIEACTAVIAACLVVMKPIFVTMMRKVSQISLKRRDTSVRSPGATLQQHPAELLSKGTDARPHSRKDLTAYNTGSNATTVGRNNSSEMEGEPPLPFINRQDVELDSLPTRRDAEELGYGLYGKTPRGR